MQELLDGKQDTDLGLLWIRSVVFLDLSNDRRAIAAVTDAKQRKQRVECDHCRAEGRCAEKPRQKENHRTAQVEFWRYRPKTEDPWFRNFYLKAEENCSYSNRKPGKVFQDRAAAQRRIRAWGLNATQRIACNATQRIASHRIASHRIASQRIASHRIASHRIASPQTCIEVLQESVETRNGLLTFQGSQKVLRHRSKNHPRKAWEPWIFLKA